MAIDPSPSSTLEPPTTKQKWLSAHEIPLTLALTLQHGTKRFNKATGTIGLSGTFSASAPFGTGPTSGSLTGNLQPAPRAGS